MARVDKTVWQAPFEVRELTAYIDPRGRLFEILRFVDDGIEGKGQIYTFSLNPGIRRGDHYHHTKHEWFTCVHGTVTVLLDDLHGRTQAVVMDADKPVIVYTAPGTTHALVNESPEVAVVLSYGSIQHDHDAPDTYPAVAMKERG